MRPEPSPEPPTIETRVAHAGHEDHAYRGFMVFRDLEAETTLAGLLSLGIAGRRLGPEEAEVLDELAWSWTVADPRIWPLKVTRLAASYGGFLPGLAAGLVSVDCRFVGAWRNAPAAARWLLRLRQDLGPELDHPRALTAAAEDLVASRPYLAGFGVPYRREDERVPALRRRLEARDRLKLPYLRLFDAVTEVVRREWDMEPNIAGLAAAVCLDLGFELPELGPLMIALAVHMFIANAHEGALQRSPALRRLPDEKIRYVGKPPRKSPRAR